MWAQTLPCGCLAFMPAFKSDLVQTSDEMKVLERFDESKSKEVWGKKEEAALGVSAHTVRGGRSEMNRKYKFCFKVRCLRSSGWNFVSNRMCAWASWSAIWYNALGPGVTTCNPFTFWNCDCSKLFIHLYVIRLNGQIECKRWNPIGRPNVRLLPNTEDEHLW